MRRKFMPMKAVNLLHQSLSPVAGKGMTDFLRGYKADPDFAPSGFNQVQKPRPVAETFTLAINSSVIPILSYTGRAGKTEIRLSLLI